MIHFRAEPVPVEITGPKNEVEALEENPDPLPADSANPKNSIRAIVDVSMASSGSAPGSPIATVRRSPSTRAGGHHRCR